MKIVQRGDVTFVDGLFTESEINRMDQYFSEYTLWGLGYDELDYGASTATLCRSLKWDQWVGVHRIFNDIQLLMTKRLHQSTEIKVPLFSRCLINNFKFGDSPMFHRDSPSNPEGRTFMVYPNKVWDHNWGGYTVFADEDLDVINVAAPKPGRIVIFPGKILHAGVAPTKIHKGYGRFSIAYQDPLGNPKQEDLKHCKPEDINKTSMVEIYGENYYELTPTT